MKTVAALAVLAAGVANAAHLTPHAAKLWAESGRAKATDRKGFTVGMVMKDAAKLKATLADISNPMSPNYGKWLSAAEANAITATPLNIVAEVYEWATSTGAQCVTKPEALVCDASVAQLEALTGATFSYYTHKESGEIIIRTSMASANAALPTTLAGKVTIVSGLVELPMRERAGRRAPKPEAGDYYIVPETLTQFYNVKSSDSSPAASVGPIEFQNCGSPTVDDMNLFATNTAIPQWVIPTNQTIGPYVPAGDGCYEESSLDEQYVVAMAPNSAKWYVTVPAWQYEMLVQVGALNNSQIPTVFSISYGWSEQDQCRWSPATPPCNGSPAPAGSDAYVAAVNDQYAKLTARGISVLVSAGDSGAHGRTDEECATPQTHPDFPTSSPYVTSVGATAVFNGVTSPTAFKAPICAATLQCATGGSEVVAGSHTMPNVEYSTGGGFSEVAAQPSWQTAAIATYLNTAGALVGGPTFNKTGRGYPDIAALGHMFYVELGKEVVGVDGTSASTPVVAGLIGSLNAWRIANGKPVLGFLNPLLYTLGASTPGAFNDITSGDNSCTEAGCSAGCSGFAAVKGWDASTGWGTPNYEGMKAGITALGI